MNVKSKRFLENFYFVKSNGYSFLKREVFNVRLLYNYRIVENFLRKDTEMVLKTEVLAATMALSPLENAAVEHGFGHDNEPVKSEIKKETVQVNGVGGSYQGMVTSSLGIGDKNSKVQEIGANGNSFYTTDTGCAFVVNNGEAKGMTLSAVLEKDGAIHYYLHGEKGREELSPEDGLAQRLKGLYKNYGDKNSSFAAKMNETARQSVKEQMKSDSREQKTTIAQQAKPHEMVTTGISKPAIYARFVQNDYGLGKDGFQYHESADSKTGTYVSNNGVALVIDGGDKGMTVYSSAVENGKVKCYASVDNGVKTECNDANIKDLLGKAFQQYGDQNSAYAKALKVQDAQQRMEQKTEQKVEQKAQPKVEQKVEQKAAVAEQSVPQPAQESKAQGSGVHKTAEGLEYSFTADGRMNVSGSVMELHPQLYFNKNRQYVYGKNAVSHFDQSAATQFLEMALRQRVVENDIKLRQEKGEQISDVEQAFLKHMENSNVATNEALCLERDQDGKLVSTNPLVGELMNKSKDEKPKKKINLFGKNRGGRD